jgi:hypothetical protein
MLSDSETSSSPCIFAVRVEEDASFLSITNWLLAFPTFSLWSVFFTVPHDLGEITSF